MLLAQEDHLTVAFARWAYAAPFLLPFFLLNRESIFQVNPGVFVFTLAILMPLEILAVIFYMKAYRLSDLSLAAPFQSFTPVFAMVIAFFLLREVPRPLGLLGVLCVVAGGYIMGAGVGGWKGLATPIRNLASEKGTLYMLAVAFIYGITSVMGKVGVLQIGSIAFAGLYIPLLSVVFAVFLAFYHPKALKEAFSRPVHFLLLGFFIAIMVYTHFRAIELIDVAYMISVKRFSMVIAVILGRFLLKERFFFARLTGGAVMFMGVVFIALWS